MNDGYCISCTSGTYNSVAGSTSCQSCPIGYTTASGPQTSIASCTLNSGMIAGVVVGFSLIISCAIFYIRKKRKKAVKGVRPAQKSRIISSSIQGTRNTRNHQVVNRVQSTPLPARSDIANTQGVYQFNYPQPIVAVQENNAFDFNNGQGRPHLNATEFTTQESHVVQSHLDPNIGFSSPKTLEFEKYKSFYD